MSVLVGEKVDDRKNEKGDSSGDDSGEIYHDLMEWHPTSGLLALTTYRTDVGSEINFYTHQVCDQQASKLLPRNNY